MPVRFSTEEDMRLDASEIGKRCEPILRLFKGSP